METRAAYAKPGRPDAARFLPHHRGSAALQEAGVQSPRDPSTSSRAPSERGGGGKILVQIQEEAAPADRILQTIEELPGLNIQEIADRVEASRGAVRHHVYHLIRDRLVVCERQGNHRFHFAIPMHPARRRAIALLRLASVRSIVGAVLRPQPTGPEILVSPGDVAAETGLSRSCVYRSLRALERAGLARAAPAGARGRYSFWPHPELRVAWVLYCKDAPQAPPLRAAPMWMLGFGILFGKLAVGTSAAS